MLFSADIHTYKLTFVSFFFMFFFSHLSLRNNHYQPCVCISNNQYKAFCSSPIHWSYLASQTSQQCAFSRRQWPTCPRDFCWKEIRPCIHLTLSVAQLPLILNMLTDSPATNKQIVEWKAGDRNTNEKVRPKFTWFASCRPFEKYIFQFTPFQ